MSAAAPHIVIKPPSRWAPLNLREVWAFRDLLTRLTIRDLKPRRIVTTRDVAGDRSARAEFTASRREVVLTVEGATTVWGTRSAPA